MNYREKFLKVWENMQSHCYFDATEQNFKEHFQPKFLKIIKGVKVTFNEHERDIIDSHYYNMLVKPYHNMLVKKLKNEGCDDANNECYRG